MEMDEYQTMEQSKLDGISHDLDALAKMIGGSKMGESYDSGLVTGMLANKGVDPSILALMKDNDGFGGGNGLLLVLFLLILGGNGGIYGRGGCDYAKESTVLNQNNFNALMNAITQQGTKQEVAIGDLATRFGCDIGQVKQALCGVDKAIALSNGDLKSAIQSCCCNVRQEIAQASAKTDLELVKGFGDVKQDIQATRYLVTAQGAAQDAMINDRFCSLRTEMNAQFNDIKLREDQREIQQLRTLLADSKAQANKNQIIAAILAPKSVGGTLDTTAGTFAGTVPSL